MKKIISLILAVLLCLGAVPLTVFADEDEVINFVTLGASNVNGYGLHGYLAEEYYEAPWTIDGTTDISGYQRVPDGSYPDLIKEYLEGQGKKVHLDQLACSGMRIGDIRVLLDDTYYGDAFTAWRFYGEHSDHWFQRSYNGYYKTNLNEEAALAALRKEYQNAIKNADLITLDVGINDFGAYVSNRIFNKMYLEDEIDETVLSEEELAYYEEIKEKVEEKLTSYVADETIDAATAQQFQAISTTYAYAMAGFRTNFDATIAKIRELNPDADVVVVSIQNVMSGMMAMVGGKEIPFGDIHGAITNLANLYMAIGSPYHDQYYCADARENDRVAFFVDDFVKFNGDIDSVTAEMKDCYDVYINTEGAYLKDNIRHLYYENILKPVLEPVLGAEMLSALGMTDYRKVPYGELAANLGAVNPGYAQTGTVLDAVYNNALDSAYVAETLAFQEAVKDNTVSLDVYVNNPESSQVAETYLLMGANKIAEKAAILGVLNTIQPMIAQGMTTLAPIADACLKQLALPGDHSFDVKEAVEGLFAGDVTKVLTEKEIVGLFTSSNKDEQLVASMFDYDLSVPSIRLKEGMEELIRTVANIGVRISISNCFCSHPNRDGHEELKDYILDAWENKTTGPVIVANVLENSEKSLKKLSKDWDEELFDTIVECIREDALDSIFNAVAKLPDDITLSKEQQLAFAQIAMDFANDQDFDKMGEVLAQVGFIGEDSTEEMERFNRDYGLSMTTGDLLAISYYYAANDDANFTARIRPLLTALVQNARTNINANNYGILGPLVNAFVGQQVQRTKQQYYNQINNIRTIEDFQRFLSSNSSYIDPQEAETILTSLGTYGNLLLTTEQSGQMLNAISDTLEDYFDHPEKLFEHDEEKVSCFKKEEVTLSGNGGDYYLFAGDTNLGEYTFAKSGNGWTIQNKKTEQYLAIADTVLKNTEDPYVWTYRNGRFSGVVTTTTTTTSSSGSTVSGIIGFIGSLFGRGNNNRPTTTVTNTTYYLVYNNAHKLTISTGTNNCPVLYSWFESDAHDLKEVPAVAATCTEEGNKAYWICERCGDLFEDAEGTQPITLEDTVIGIDDDAHALTEVPAAAATCTEEGNKAYWICERCGDLFEDAEGTQPIMLEDTVIGIDDNAHEWGTWTSISSTEHQRVCLSNSGHKETENHNTDGEDGACSLCGYKEGAVVCTGRQAVTLRGNGSHHFYQGSNDLGLYHFTQQGGKWAIQKDEGRYVTFANGAIGSSSAAAYDWTLTNGRFTASVTTTTTGGTIFDFWGFLFGRGNGNQGRTTTTTYYLVVGGDGALTVSTSSSNVPTIYDIVTNDHHTWGAWTGDADSHQHTCTICGVTEVSAHVYDENEPYKCECGRTDPAHKNVIISVRETTGQGSARFNFWPFFGGNRSATSYTYTVTVTGAVSPTVQYSTNGTSWRSGSTYTTSTRLNTLYVRVTDSDGESYSYTWTR